MYITIGSLAKESYVMSAPNRVHQLHGYQSCYMYQLAQNERTRIGGDRKRQTLLNVPKDIEMWRDMIDYVPEKNVT